MNAKPEIAMIFNGVWSQYAVATAPKYRELIELIYVHDLPRVELAGYCGLIVPFQTDHDALGAQRARLHAMLARGGRIAVFGDAGAWTGADWAERPVDNAWWRRTPAEPPVPYFDSRHPLFAGLSARQAGWHHHGVYTRIPASARVLQRSLRGEVVSWSTTEHGGELFAGTQDPIVEHGVQQIRHLDHFVDRLLLWLGGRAPIREPMRVDPAAYGRSFERRI